MRELQQALIKQKAIYDRAFLPNYIDDEGKKNPYSVQPFPQQEAFLRDTSLTKLARCGNRAAKTFTTCREFSWFIMRKHWYNQKWQTNDYTNSGSKIFWIVGPDFEFCKTVIWEQTLKTLIPEWYYTDDNLEQMLEMTKYQGKEVITAIRFRNGDRLEFKTYQQNLRALMGRAVHAVLVDEMPSDHTILVELVARCLDHDAPLLQGFTPVVHSEDVREYIDNHASLSVHSWSVLDNPKFRDNPERKARLLAEYAQLSDGERAMRLNGDWYYEPKTGRVFDNVHPIIVPDDEVLPRINSSWRQVRVCDPATHRSGFCIFAEDPEDCQWYCIYSTEIEWKNALAKAEDIEKECDRHSHFPSMTYDLSIYDNAETWFGLYVKNTMGRWRPCVKKEKEKLIMLTRDAVVSGKVKFLKMKAAPVVKQIYLYERRDDGSIKKKKDHMLDCLQYFCREMPTPRRVSTVSVIPNDDRDAMKKKFLEDLENEGKQTTRGRMQKRIMNRRLR